MATLSKRGNILTGPRRIFTPRAVVNKDGAVHMVKLGRSGRQAWLQVDNLDNVTGTSPGHMTELNTRSVVYIGNVDLHFNRSCYQYSFLKFIFGNGEFLCFFKRYC